MPPVPFAMALTGPPMASLTPAGQGKLAGKPFPPSKIAMPAQPTAASLEQEQFTALAERCRTGDGAAWAELVRTQNRRVYSLCYRFTGDQADAEDLTQDVFLKVHRNLSNFDSAKGSFQTWLMTLARNLLVDHVRRSRNDRATDSLDANWQGEDDGPQPLSDKLEDTGPSAYARAANRELSAIIQQALCQLSPELREAVVLRDLQDLDYKEIASVLRVPEGTVKSRISRGRAELARLLERRKEQVM
jgi:RNA polymerase sigma-70 factor (ECF subfamily)